MRGEIELINNENLLTPIQRYYTGAHVFITGGTGFLGKILIEKLLRSCPDLSALYLLIRSKKGKHMQQRVDELFDDVIFDRLRQENPKFRHQVVGIGGDCSLPDLGLSIQDRQLLINEVSMVFHVAATVRFDEKLKLAVAINVRAPQEILHLCREMTHLKSAIHVSTAYSNCQLKMIEEQFYTSPMDYRKLMALTDSANDKLLDRITPMVIEEWPNTYAYTKAVAEDVIRHEGVGLPVGVFRPSVVVSTYKEPIKGWINNMYGPTGVCAGAGTGVLRTLHCDSNVNANIIPVDMCVNALIAMAWEVGETYELAKRDEKPYEIPVYHYESSTLQPISWGRFMHWSAQYGIEMPSVKAIWYYCLTLQSTLVGYYMAVLLLHFLPAAFCDFALFCIGKKPRLLKIYKKVHKFSAVISHFALHNWEFKSERMLHLWQRMSKQDQQLFFSDLRELDWQEFFKEYLKGIRLYLIGDPIETIDAARTRWNRLYWLHQTCKTLVILFLLRLIWMITSYILM